MGLKSYLNAYKEDISLVYNECFKGVPIKNENQSRIAESLLKKNRAYNILVERQNLKFGYDLQEQLKGNLEPMTIEKAEKLLDSKAAELQKQKEKELNESMQDIGGKVGVNLSNEDKTKIEKELKEKSASKVGIKSGEEYDANLRALVIKAVYEDILDKQHRLVEQIQTGNKGQLDTGELDRGKKGIQIIALEKARMTLELEHKNITGKYITGDLQTKDDEELANKENEYTLEEEKNKSIINEKASDEWQEKQKLQAKLDDITEEIIEITNKDRPLTLYENLQVDNLQKECEKIVFDLVRKEPNLKETEKMTEEVEKEEKLRTEVVGDSDLYDKTIFSNSKLGPDTKGNIGENENAGKNIQNNIKESTFESNKEAQKKRKNLLKDAQDALNTGDLDTAAQNVETVQVMGGAQKNPKGEIIAEPNISGDAARQFENYLKGAAESRENILEIDILRIKEQQKEQENKNIEKMQQERENKIQKAIDEEKIK
ncbi:MAG: hypothetical protein RSE00_02515 [Clostridia bacterium]